MANETLTHADLVAQHGADFADWLAAVCILATARKRVHRDDADQYVTARIGSWTMSRADAADAWHNREDYDSGVTPWDRVQDLGYAGEVAKANRRNGC